MAEAGTHIFRVTLREEPSVYRDIEIGSGKSLAKLAEAIVRAFDFEFDHAFGFYPDTKGGAVMRGRPAYELFADMGEATGTQSARKTRIGAAFREALVGTPLQVDEALLEYHALGVSTFLIRGFDPLEDAVEYGRELLPTTRRLVAERLARTAPAMAAG